MALSPEEKARRKIARHVQQILEVFAEKEGPEGAELLDLKNTPRRVAKAFVNEMLAYGDPPDLHITNIPEGTGDIVAVGPLSFSSTCAHHLLPIVGDVYVAYLADRKIMGLSKFGRIVEHYARRLQLQERLTRQVLDHIVSALDPKGALVVCVARHECMGCRGVNKPHARTTTSALYPSDTSTLHDRVLDELYRTIERCRNDADRT